MVVYGDSHAGMWGSALETIATRIGWRLESFYLPGCTAPDLPLISLQTNNPNTQCTKFHDVAVPTIRALHPNLVVVTSESTGETASGVYATPAEWQSGLEKTLKSLSEPGTALSVIGDIPQWNGDDANCLAANMNDVQACAVPTSQALSPDLQAEKNAAALSGAQYVSTTAAICEAKCEPIVNNMRVYLDEYHLTNAYVHYLSGPLQQAMDLPNY
jgi:hypothetical protein